MTFELISKITGTIISTIQETAVASVRALKKHTYSAKIENFPKVQKVSGKVEVTNQTPITKRQDSLLKVARDIYILIKKWRFPSEIKVSNFPIPPKFPEYPKQINVGNFPKFPEFPKRIGINNWPTEHLQNVVVEMGEIKKAIKAQKLDPKISVEAPPAPPPVVVPAPRVSVTQTEIDYAKLSEEVAKAVPKIDYDKLSKAIAEEIGQMKITASGGGGGRYAFQTTDGERTYGLVNKLRQLSTVNEDRWGMNDTAKVNKTTYTGEQDVDGNWIVRKITKVTGGVLMRYATIKNNPSITDYETAWGGRADLDYGLYQDAFTLE